MNPEYYKAYTKHLTKYIGRNVIVELKTGLPDQTMEIYDQGNGGRETFLCPIPEDIDGTLMNVGVPGNTIEIKMMSAAGVFLDYLICFDDIVTVDPKPLTVAELIEKLKTMPQDMVVAAYDIEEGHYGIMNISQKDVIYWGFQYK